MTNKKDKEKYTLQKEAINDCPLLYNMAHRSCQETCMCWGWECGKGWKPVIDKYSRIIESVNNIFYKKYRVRIQADQVKEKYGTLSFYYSVVEDPCAFYIYLARFFDYIDHKLVDIKYDMKKVVDVEPYKYDDKREITTEDYESVNYGASNVEYVLEGNKIFEIVHLQNFGESHYEPTKHKILYKIMMFCRHMRMNLMNRIPTKRSSGVNNAISFLEDFAETTVKRMEKECYNTCEDCGHQIGTEWSPRCMTHGYITYICKDCAEKGQNSYSIDGDKIHIYQNGKVIETIKNDNIE